MPGRTASLRDVGLFLFRARWRLHPELPRRPFACSAACSRKRVIVLVAGVAARTGAVFIFLVLAHAPNVQSVGRTLGDWMGCCLDPLRGPHSVRTWRAGCPVCLLVCIFGWACSRVLRIFPVVPEVQLRLPLWVVTLR